MKEVKYKFSAIWANLDPNGHMRHTAYNDYCAQARLLYFEDLGIPFSDIMKMGVGPILFREDTRFLKEIRMNESFEVGFSIIRLRKDGSKWSFRHNIYNSKGEPAAKIEVDGAWIDLKARKITVPPKEVTDRLNVAVKADDFEWIPDKVRN